MSKYNTSMFEQIKASLNKQTSSGFKDVLRMEAGNNYVGRLLPNLENINDTFFHYYSFGWDSLETGQYVSAVSPMSFGERCPINELRVKLYNSGSESDKSVAQKIRRSEQWLVNFYVIDDPTNQNNNDEVKILRYGKQLDKIFKEAIEGDDADEFGPAVFDLSENGCSFRIKVEKNEGGYNSYTSSRFLSPAGIKNMSDTRIEEVYNSVHDLSGVHQIKTYEELQEMLSVHFNYNGNVISTAPSYDLPEDSESEEEDELPYDFEEEEKEEKPVAKAKSSKKKTSAKKKEETLSEEEKSADDLVDELLADL